MDGKSLVMLVYLVPCDDVGNIEPVWAAKGRTREDLSLPFDLKTDQAVKDRGGYFSSDIVINAQTGQAYDLLNDKRPDRLHVPHIITWDEVN